VVHQTLRAVRISCYTNDMSEPKYAAIVDALRAELRTRSAGERFWSEHQVALRFKVSRPTAARALSELVLDGLVERRVGSGTFVRTGGAESGAGRTFGLLLSGLGTTEVWDPLSAWLTRVCSSRGISVRMGWQVAPRDDVVSTVAQAKDLVAQGVDGVLFSPLEIVPDRERENIAIAELFTDAGIPVTLLDRDVLDFPGRSGFDVVGVDNVYAAAEIGRHLATTGRVRPRFFSRPHFPSTTDLRVAGCAIALAQAGIDLPRDWHVTGDPSDPDAVLAFLDEHRPDAVVANNDRTAALLIQTFARLGRRVPDDLAVIGFDDVVYSTLLTVSLTTVRQPFDDIARTAVRVLLDRIEHRDAPPTITLLPGTLVVRESSAPPGAPRA
jgi:LacI family transcriptional regulator